MGSTVLNLWKILWFLTHSYMGIATTFSADDPFNPNPLLYCTNKIINDNEKIVAHPTLPCGTVVTLYAPRTKKVVKAVVRDRGPRHALVDLSIAVTKALGANGEERVFMGVIK